MKFVLLAMSDYANEHDCNELYASITTIANKTSLDIKTVQKHILTLENQGYIQDTGRRKGRTNSIKIWSMDLNKIISTPKNGAPPKLPISTPKNGGTKHPQKRVIDPLVINLKKRLEEKTPDELLNPTEIMFLKPDPVDVELWDSFMKLRVRKKASQTKRGLTGITNRLIECVENSISMNDMISLCLQESWKGVNYKWYLNHSNDNPQNNQYAGYK